MKQLAAAALVALVLAAAAQAEPAAPPPPTARDFATYFLGVTNTYASVGVRFVHASCVEAARGRYMCSYATLGPGAAKACHLVQARWTPNAASSITVTLASRTPLCGSLREALASLR